MKTILRIFISAVLVMLIAHFMDGVVLKNGIETSIIVAVVLSLLNLIVKPILILFTLPVTLVTFGLFLLVINAIIIVLCSKLVSGFHIDGFGTAFIFSILLSISQSILFRLTKENQ